MNRSELVTKIADTYVSLTHKDVELAVDIILDAVSAALKNGDRVEIRGFGSFSIHQRPPRMGRNPKTGDAVAIPAKWVPHFKAGKDLKERVDQ